MITIKTINTGMKAAVNAFPFDILWYSDKPYVDKTRE